MENAVILIIDDEQNILYETDEGQSTVSIVNPMAMLGVVENEALQKVANEAQARLRRVIETLVST